MLKRRKGYAGEVTSGRRTVPLVPFRPLIVIVLVIANADRPAALSPAVPIVIDFPARLGSNWIVSGPGCRLSLLASRIACRSVPGPASFRLVTVKVAGA